MDYSKSYYDRTQNVVDRYIIKYSELFKPNNKVLDIGCGTGANSKFLKDLGAVVTSFDGSDNAKPYCDRNGVQMTVCDITKFNYQPNIYDNVICINVLHHLPVYDQKMILPKICNSVKKDGYIFIEIMENYGHSTDKSLSSEDVDSIMSSLGFSKVAIESYKMDNSYKKFICYIYKRESIPDDNYNIGEGTMILDEDTYITSDIHIYRTAKDKLRYDDEYTTEVIKTINDTVGVNDTLLFLGDLMFKQDPKLYENTKKFISMIRCKNLYLVLGNHDVLPVDDYIDFGFKGVYDKIVTKDYVFTHFPVNVETGKINIHGHIHGTREYWNVSADRHIDVFWKMNENKPHRLKYYLNEYKKGKYEGKTVMREQTPFEPRLDNPETLVIEEGFGSKILFSGGKKLSKIELLHEIKKCKTIDDCKKEMSRLKKLSAEIDELKQKLDYTNLTQTYSNVKKSIFDKTYMNSEYDLVDYVINMDIFINNEAIPWLKSKMRDLKEKESSINESYNQPNNLSVLLEYYRGKQPELIKCESLLQEIIDDTMKKYKNNNLSSVNITDMKQNKEIEKILSNLFNANIHITWMTGNSDYAHTILNPRLPFIKNKIAIMIYDRLIWEDHLTSGEMMAFIIHEIGHKLSKSIFIKIMHPLIFSWKNVLNLISSQTWTELFTQVFITIPLNCVVWLFPEINNKIKQDIQKIIKKIIPMYYDVVLPFVTYIYKNPMLNTLCKGITLFNKMRSDIINMLVIKDTDIEKMATDFRTQGAIAGMITSKIFNLMMYREEQIADSLAMSYGYGTELASGLIKIETDYSDYLNIECAVSDLYNVLIFRTLDNHPTTHQRILSQIKSLRYDLENNKMDDGMKKYLIDDLKTLEQMELKYDKLSTQDKLVITSTLDKICKDITGEVDIDANITRIDKSKVRF